MAQFQFTIDEQKIQQVLFGDRGVEVLVEELINQLLQAEMTEHLQAEQHEQWSTGRKYLKMDEYFRWKASLSEVETETKTEKELAEAA